MHQTSLRIPLTIERGASFVEDVVVKVSTPPPGVTADPITMTSTDRARELVLHVSVDAKQGPLTLTVDGMAGADTATVNVPIFVRGKSGTVDTTFGEDGKRDLWPDWSRSDGLRTVAIGSDDSIYVAAECNVEGTPLTCGARLSADGVKDPNYGTGSYLFDASPQVAVVDREGRLLVGGGPGYFAIERFTKEGKRDTSFTVHPEHELPSSFVPSATGTRGISLCPDGTFYVAFEAGVFFGVERFSSAGARVNAFNSTGFAGFSWDYKSSISGIRCEPNNAVTLFGTYSNGPQTEKGYGVARYTSRGDHDQTFSDMGKAMFTRKGARPVSNPVRLPDGRTVAAFRSDIAHELVMFTSAGNAIDTTFGKNGYVTIPHPAGTSPATLLRQTDANLVLGLPDRIVRTKSDGQMDSSFGTDGSTQVAVGPIGLLSDNRIIVVAFIPNTSKGYRVTRLWD